MLMLGSGVRVAVFADIFGEFAVGLVKKPVAGLTGDSGTERTAFFAGG